MRLVNINNSGGILRGFYMKEFIENYSLVVAVVCILVIFTVWNLGSYLYFKYFDSDEKRIKRLNNEWED